MTTALNNPTDPNRILASAFAQVFGRNYLEASDAVQTVIRDMCVIIADQESDPEEIEAATVTLMEALFPVRHNGELGIGIDDLRDVLCEHDPEESGVVFSQVDVEDRQFATALKSVLDKRGMNQTELAELIGVQQPAISMMLARKCRPQRATVEKIAKALGMEPAELWPNFDQQ